MRVFISLLLFLCVFTSSAHANRAVKVKRIDLLRDAVSKMVKVPGLTEKMAWEKGGVAIDELIAYLSVHEQKSITHILIVDFAESWGGHWMRKCKVSC